MGADHSRPAESEGGNGRLVGTLVESERGAWLEGGRRDGGKPIDVLSEGLG